MADISFWGWVLLTLGAFSIGLSKTGVPGIGILSVATFALVLPSAVSVGVILPVLISADIVAVIAYRRQAAWHHLWRLFPWAIAGIFVGYAVGSRINSQQVGQLLGAILLLIIALSYWNKWHEKRNVPPAIEGVEPLPDAATPSENAPRPSFFYTAGVGIAAGFTTMVGNAAGPIMTLYLLAMRLPKMEFIGTGAWYFLLLNCFKIPFMMQLGWIDGSSFPLSLRLMPFAMFGAIFGRAIVHLIDQMWFERIAISLTIVAALRLLLS